MTKQQTIDSLRVFQPEPMNWEKVAALISLIDEDVEPSDDPGDAGYPDEDRVEMELRHAIGMAVENELENTDKDELIDLSGVEFTIEDGNEIQLDLDSVSVNYEAIADIVIDRIVTNLFEDYNITEKK
jgi:hypothetical protein